ncbi:hypothetical protein Tco_1479406 [Tanacetum coccineum]
MATAQDASSSSDKEKLKELTVINPTPSTSTPSSSSSKPKTSSFWKNFHELATALQSTLKEVLPSMVDIRVNEIAKMTIPLYVVKGLLLDRQKTQVDVAAMIVEAIKKEHENLHAEITLQVTNAIANNIPSQIKFEKPVTSAAPCQIAIVRTRDHEDHHDDDARPEGENSAKRQKTSGHGTYSVGESLLEQEQNPLGPDDDELPTEEVSPELMRRASVSFYHNFQRDPKAPSTTLLNQDLFYLKYGQSGPKKYTLSLHKYPAVPFPEDDIKERTSRWVSKQIRRFNVYARYSVEHLKNIWAKQD